MPLRRLLQLLVHVELFGRGYVGRTLSAARHAAALAWLSGVVGLPDSHVDQITQ